eukprot:CAMPEP_0170621620 /NCGR_PEP_ID=MMETSP0224-20130122/28695_1 /TAXON_ID=285029 /ORGANISM="Togula jolla, Strain CCCM 725" /LENGTH=52 /DNA_ID=CAMNT_0010947885 /DNA_START=218 /DNA_END=376 /DNA_ORIENTATION=+
MALHSTRRLSRRNDSVPRGMAQLRNVTAIAQQDASSEGDIELVIRDEGTENL